MHRRPEAVAPVPRIESPVSADAIGPVGLGSDPLKIHPAAKSEKAGMDGHRHRIKGGFMACASNEGHESRHVVYEPRAPSATEKLKGSSSNIIIN